MELPPALAVPTPRALPPLGWAPWFGLVFCLLVIAMGGIVLADGVTDLTLDRNPALEAEITSVEPTARPSFVIVHYTRSNGDGTRSEGSELCARESAPSVGERVAAWKARTPTGKLHEAIGPTLARHRSDGQGNAFAGGAMIAVFLIVLLGVGRRIQRERALIRDGSVAFGVVERSLPGGKTRYVYYTYEIGGVTHRGTGGVAADTVPAPGDQVVLLYDPTRPARSLLYGVTRAHRGDPRAPDR